MVWCFDENCYVAIISKNIVEATGALLPAFRAWKHSKQARATEKSALCSETQIRIWRFGWALWGSKSPLARDKSYGNGKLLDSLDAVCVVFHGDLLTRHGIRTRIAHPNGGSTPTWTDVIPSIYIYTVLEYVSISFLRDTLLRDKVRWIK